MRALTAAIAAVAAILVEGGRNPAAAFVCQTYDGENCIRWLAAEATMRPFLGPQFDPSVFFAAALWTETGAGFRFNVASGGQFNDPCTTPGPCSGTGASGDNPVFFSSGVCGRSFGNDVLAQTVNCYRLDNGGIVNSPVFFNSRVNWAVYDGPLILGATDIRRVILHELGHVAGLNHPDDAGQNVIAVMNGRVSAIDRPQQDDVAGLRFIYAGGPPPGGGGASGGCTLAPASGGRLSAAWMAPGLLWLHRACGRKRGRGQGSHLRAQG